MRWASIPAEWAGSGLAPRRRCSLPPEMLNATCLMQYPSSVWPRSGNGIALELRLEGDGHTADEDDGYSLIDTALTQVR